MKFSEAGVLVTGGGSGIGRACARRFIREGAIVTRVGRTEERLRTVATQLERTHPTQRSSGPE